MAIFDSGYDEGLWIHESIKLVETEDTITIYAYLTISGPLCPEMIIGGIELYWEGRYYISGGFKKVDIIIITGKSKYGKSIFYLTSTGDSASNTVGPVDMSGVPTVYIYARRNGVYNNPRWDAAHEFGHCLGIEDYYTHAGDEGYQKLKTGIMMHAYHHATAEEIGIVLQAFHTGQYQFWEEFVK